MPGSSANLASPSRSKAGKAEQPSRPAAHEPASASFPVVAIGASAGGLEACTGLLDALPAGSGMAFILVQHLDPTHESLMVELLATHTSLTVEQAADGMRIEPEHLYIIPPAFFLTLSDGLLRLKPAPGRRGARLPFDALLLSVAQECGARARCVVLSGTGSDGSVGVLAIKKDGGVVFAQEPSEAAYDGMPRSAIATGAVDAVLPVAAIASRLGNRGADPDLVASGDGTPEPQDHLQEIIDLLRTRTSQNFTLYKPGTLRRRVERRVAMAGMGLQETARYVALLRDDPAELERLAKDLLIHVTSFFRDPAVFDILARTIVLEMVRLHPPDRALRIWIAGCSTGEEAYSLAILFHEQIAAADRSLKLQVFASDADPDAVASARDGLYPAVIEADVTPARLATYFTTENQHYRVTPELRSMVVFTVQDLLVDPPFSRLDFVSCRNVMIYLGPEGQRKIVTLFHFALRTGGVLLLGSSESVGEAAGRFDVISKAAQLYRHVGRSRAGDLEFARSSEDTRRAGANEAATARPSRQAALADLSQRRTLDAHAPATVLVTRAHESLYSLGPTDRYLRVPPGHPTSDVLAMVSEDLRPSLRAAILRAVQETVPVVVRGGRTRRAGRECRFTIEVHPVLYENEQLLLIHFVDEPERLDGGMSSPADANWMAELERELKSTREELEGAVRSLQISSDEQKAINENALSVNEEFQSTNEELLTSKEELQSLNEELTALNSQLQETLEQQRTSANDLQNVLFSTDVATLFLDAELRIRFFTPATKSLFNVIKTDVGRPLADLHSLAADRSLADDCRGVIETQIPIEREISTPAGVWCRRVLPYRTHDGTVEGVVMTFTDITERKHAAAALEAAKREAELANAAKSQFLAAASHDLRQPLQTLALLQGLLAKRAGGTESDNLVARLDDTVGAMSAMLNTLLDVNQIEAGVVRAEAVDFSIDDLLHELGDAFAYPARANGLDLRVVFCGLTVRSDPRLLEQMLRNLLSNAVKYTQKGKILLGCRRSGAAARIEVWDTGIGIPDGDLLSIFEEYRQLDNAARKRARGMGLGLSIVQRLGDMLGHKVAVRSRPGRGSVFSVEVPLRPSDPAMLSGPGPGLPRSAQDEPVQSPAPRTGTVLVVEDDPQVRDLLAMLLSDDGHRAAVVPDGAAAMALVEHGSARPELLLTDYNLPHGMDGLAVAAGLRARLGAELPVIMLTGDISTGALSAIAAQRCLKLNKPVKPAELRQAIQDLLPLRTGTRPTQEGVPYPDPPVVYLVDDDRNVRDAIRILLENDGQIVQDFATGEAFLAAYRPGADGCLLIDAYLPGIGGLDVLARLRAGGDPLPAIVITGSSDVPMAVQAMKAGAADFIEKPIAAAELLASIDQALERSRDSYKQNAWQASAAEHIAGLTPRQHQIMDLVLAGHPSKNIAADLGISQRTVENHRASIMRKMGTKSLPGLARLALAASRRSETT